MPIRVGGISVRITGATCSHRESVNPWRRIVTCRSPNRQSILTYMLLLIVLDVREYIDTAGRSPFTKWLRALNVHAAAKVATALERVAGGTKKRQQEDIRQAKANWEDYRNRKT